MTTTNGFCLALAFALHGAGDQLFADAAFALDQHGNVGCRRALAERDDALHGVAAHDKIGEGERALVFLLETRDLALQGFDFERALHRDVETLGARGLDDEVDGAGAHRVMAASIEPCAVCTMIGGMPGFSATRASTAMPSTPGITRSSRTTAIEPRSGPSRILQGLFATLRGLGFIAETFDIFFQQTTLDWIVIDDQDALGHFHELDATTTNGRHGCSPTGLFENETARERVNGPFISAPDGAYLCPLRAGLPELGQARLLQQSNGDRSAQGLSELRDKSRQRVLRRGDHGQA